jgi:quercetin dioxygenase-like cupin family protein
VKGRMLAGPAMLAAALVAGCAQEEARQAEPAEAEAAAKPGVEIIQDLPQGDAAQVVHVVTRDIPAGGEIPWHTHPGIEIGYVENGNVELLLAGQAPLQLAPGGHFTVQRDTVHSGRNTGAGPARLVLTYVVDKGATLRMPAEAPEGPVSGG